MTIWNWQKSDWPDFTYNAELLQPFEDRLLHESGMFLGAFKHLDESDKKQLTIELISNEALKTSEIEGEVLNRDSLQASIRRHFGLETDFRKVPPAEQGVANMMVDLYQHFDTPLSHETLFGWHKMLMNGRQDLKVVGSYRTHTEPMQVVSGYIHQPKVHFEAPPSERMVLEMTRFIEWFNRSETLSEGPLPAMTRAGIAHLHFVCIHPFEDGNGRIGRGLAEKALAQSLGHPTLIALAHVIERNKKAYYAALEKANTNNEITEWLIYFAKTLLDAQQYTLIRVEFIIYKARLFDRLQGQLNPRQTKVLLRMFREGPEGFKGGLSAENYIAITDTSRATATRDLQELVSLKALSRNGEKKYTRYYLEVQL
jgi:Fic family protein